MGPTGSNPPESLHGVAVERLGREFGAPEIVGAARRWVCSAEGGEEGEPRYRVTVWLPAAGADAPALWIFSRVGDSPLVNRVPLVERDDVDRAVRQIRVAMLPEAGRPGA